MLTSNPAIANLVPETSVPPVIVNLTVGEALGETPQVHLENIPRLSKLPKCSLWRLDV